MAILTRGELVRHRREELNLTREQLALKASVSTSTVARLELGGKLPGSENLLRLSRALNIQIEHLIDITQWPDVANERELNAARASAAG